MRPGRKSGPVVVAALALATSAACGGWWSRPAERPAAQPQAARGSADSQTVPYQPGQTLAIINELEAKLRRDPEDFVAHNKLSGYYMQLAR